MNNILIEYTRNRRGQLNGCVIAIGPNKVGWSLCRKGDKFTKKYAKALAYRRALIGNWDAGKRETIPHLIEKIIPKMTARSLKYYKQAQ